MVNKAVGLICYLKWQFQASYDQVLKVSIKHRFVVINSDYNPAKYLTSADGEHQVWQSNAIHGFFLQMVWDISSRSLYIHHKRWLEKITNMWPIFATHNSAFMHIWCRPIKQISWVILCRFGFSVVLHTYQWHPIANGTDLCSDLVTHLSLQQYCNISMNCNFKASSFGKYCFGGHS